MKWDNATVPMRDPSQLRDTNIDAFEAEIFSIHDFDITIFMDIKYGPADIDTMVSKCNHLTNNERDNLKRLLLKFEPLFNGKL
jgi:hypothetical protein